MSHQDTGCHTASLPHHQALKQALDWLLHSMPLSDLNFRGECTWTPKTLIISAVLWAWSDERSLTERFFLARKVTMAMGPLIKLPATSYQAFLKMLKIWTVTLTVLLDAAFRRRMQTDLAERFEIVGFAVFGVDGSRLELPRTESNEERFSPAKARRRSNPKPCHTPRRRACPRSTRARGSRQKKMNSPQLWLTTMFHVGSGLPWGWRIGPSDSSERGHLLEMLAALPSLALITADAGFVGYETWKKILAGGRHLLIRVGANVRLLKGLGYVQDQSGLVSLWPDREAARNQLPVVLRLVVVQGGKHPVYLVTSVLDETAISDKQVVEIYALRWGIELFHRHFKQTFERRKLRSHCGDSAETEATWSLLELRAMGLHAQVELANQGMAGWRISVAKVLRAYRRSLREYKSRPAAGESLGKAVIDPCKRADKTSREYPRKKQGRAIGAPKIELATRSQIEMAREIREQHESGLTA